MKKTHGFVLGLALAMMGIGGSATAEGRKIVKVDGSSTVFPITEAVAEEFQGAKRGAVQVTVGISGTGGGFKKFCRGEIDVSDASRPILKEEMELCRAKGISYLELPVAFDALTIAVNPKNDWLNSVKVEDLKKMWAPEAQGVVAKWNAVRAEWPDAPLKLFGAGSDSGTFDYFTEAVVGKAKSSRGDYTGSEDDNTLVQGIAADKYALGYLPFSYYEENKGRLKAVAIDAGKGGVLPSLENVVNGTYTPLSRPLFIYVSAKSLERPEVKEFVAFYLQNVPALAKQVNYLPLAESVYPTVISRVEKREIGTAFGGVPEVGLRVEDLLKRALVH